MSWSVKVTVVYVSNDGIAKLDTYFKGVQRLSDVGQAVSELIGAAETDDYAVTNVSVTPVL